MVFGVGIYTLHRTPHVHPSQNVPCTEHHVSLSQNQVSLSHAWTGAGDALILHVIHLPQTLHEKWLKPRQESGFDCLLCTTLLDAL
jgi:hypothetical protein